MFLQQHQQPSVRYVVTSVNSQHPGEIVTVGTGASNFSSPVLTPSIPFDASVTCFPPGPNQSLVPLHQNTDRIVTLNLNEACSCCSSHPDARSDIVPNELMSHVVQLTIDDYRTIMNILKGQGYVRWRSCYSNCSAGILFVTISMIAVYLVVFGFIISADESVDLAFILPGFLLLGLACLYLTCRYMMCFKTATKFTNAMQAVHTISCRYNLMVGYKYVYSCSCDDDYFDFTFYFYDWRPCQAYLQAVLDVNQRRDQSTRAVPRADTDKCLGSENNIREQTVRVRNAFEPG